MKYYFFTFCMYAVAAIVFMLAAPVFVVYGISFELNKVCLWIINKLTPNPVSNYFIDKTIKHKPKEKEEDET